LCKEEGDSLLPLGLASSANFVNTNGQLSIYTVYGINNTVSTVNCFVITTRETSHSLEQLEITHTISTVCVPVLMVVVVVHHQMEHVIKLTHVATCKSTCDDLDNPYAPPTAKDNEGYTYYYNPCSGI